MIKKIENFTQSRWSGGVTTQLYIYPENSSYSDRNFKFRISKATSEIEESQFTYLPNIKRYLSILEGRLELDFGEGNRKILNPYEICYFDGGLPIKAKGIVKDFNLMLKDCNGELLFYELKEKVSFKLETQKMSGIFCISGEVSISNLKIKADEFVVIEGEDVELKTESAKIFVINIYD